MSTKSHAVNKKILDICAFRTYNSPRSTSKGGDQNDRSQAALELLDSAALLVGSPVLNNQIFPSLADVLCYLKGLRKKGLIGAVFGSYGWNGAPIDELAASLQTMQVKLTVPTLKSLFVPDETLLQKGREMGLEMSRQIAAKLNL